MPTKLQLAIDDIIYIDEIYGRETAIKAAALHPYLKDRVLSGPLHRILDKNSTNKNKQ